VWDGSVPSCEESKEKNPEKDGGERRILGSRERKKGGDPQLSLRNKGEAKVKRGGVCWKRIPRKNKRTEKRRNGATRIEEAVGVGEVATCEVEVVCRDCPEGDMESFNKKGLSTKGTENKRNIDQKVSQRKEEDQKRIWGLTQKDRDQIIREIE